MEWLTVKEAALRTGKSESAIKRLIYKLKADQPNAIKFKKNKYYISFFELQNSEKTANDQQTERTTTANDHRTTTELIIISLICVVLILLVFVLITIY